MAQVPAVRHSIKLSFTSYCHPWVPVTTAWGIPWVADGGVGLKIWRLAANILNKQSGQPTRSGPPAWGFGVTLTTSHCKNKGVQKRHTGPPNWTDNLERPWQRKMDMRFGTWNVRSLYRAGALGLVTSELDRCRMDLVGVQDVR